MGDIHGAHRALVQCLDRSGFDRDHDELIFLGDVADGWPDTKKCIDELSTVRHLHFILGNHDFWTLEWMMTGIAEDIWRIQGGEATMSSYSGGIPDSHQQMLIKAMPYLQIGNKLFVHAGINVHIPVPNKPTQPFSGIERLRKRRWMYISARAPLSLFPLMKSTLAIRRWRTNRFLRAVFG